MMLNGILKGDYQELLDVIAYEIPWPTFARQKPPLPQDLASSAPAPKLRRGDGADRERKSPAGVSGDEGLLAKKSEVHEKIC